MTDTINLKTAAQRLLEAWDTTPLMRQGDGMLQERFEVLRDALEQPSTDPAHEYRKGFVDGQLDMRDRPEEQPERTDGMPASADERYLRRLLAVRVGIPGAYYDDGEAAAEIDAKLRALNVARAEVAQPAGVDLLGPKGEHS